MEDNGKSSESCLVILNTFDATITLIHILVKKSSNIRFTNAVFLTEMELSETSWKAYVNFIRFFIL